MTYTWHKPWGSDHWFAVIDPPDGRSVRLIAWLIDERGGWGWSMQRDLGYEWLRGGAQVYGGAASAKRGAERGYQRWLREQAVGNE